MRPASGCSNRPGRRVSDEARENRRRVDTLIAEQSGPRTRVVDEHNFTVPGHVVPGTFRVQVFTGENLRPVAVATQNVRGEGASLINRAEVYAAAVWRTFLPEWDPNTSERGHEC